MRKEQAKNCWEFWGCSSADRDNCLTYINRSGKECWLLANTFSGFTDKEKSRKFNNCWDCPWFKKMNKNGFGGKIKSK